MRFKSDLFWGLGTFATVIVLWETVTRLGLVRSAILPSPSMIIPYLADALPLTLQHLRITVQRIITSFAVGLVIAVLLGILTARYPFWDKTLGKLLHGILPIPVITFIGLFILWFGVTEKTIILLSAVSVFFVIYTSVYSGVKILDPNYVEVFRNLGGSSEITLFRTVVLPGITPSLLAGLRYAIGRAIGAVIISEYLLSRDGLGYLVSRAVNEFKPELVFFYQAVIALLALVIYVGYEVWYRYTFPWLAKKQEETYAHQPQPSHQKSN